MQDEGKTNANERVSFSPNKSLEEKILSTIESSRGEADEAWQEGSGTPKEGNYG